MASEMQVESLVNSGAGEIHRRIFTDPDIYAQEQERIFKRAWLYVGHESQIPKPGDFVLSRMGEESVILTRDANGKVHVFLNSCRHRGMKVCRYDEGNTRNFTCPYHGWGYRTDGALIAVQDADKAYDPPFDKNQWGLIEVAQLATLRGTVWATWDAQAPSLEEYLGDGAFGLHNALMPWNGSDDEIELLGSTQKWVIPSNWKIVAENFSGDMLHNVSHRSVDMVGIGPSRKSGRRDASGKQLLAAYPQGHGFIFTRLPADHEQHSYGSSPETAEYFRRAWTQRRELYAERADVATSVGTIFPNMSLHGNQPRTILVAHPRGPLRTEMWRVYFVDKKAPPEVKEFLRRYYIRYSGPAGMTEQDDMENWNYATQSCRGNVAQQYPFNYQAGLGRGGVHDVIPGANVTADPVTTEQNPRALYNRWAQLMDARNWEDIPV